MNRSSLFGISATLCFLSLVVAELDARVWYVSADQSGDAPTIAAALDSAFAGDTVLVAAGTYEIQSLQMKDGVTLTSEQGPQLTRLVPTCKRAIESTPFHVISCCIELRAMRYQPNAFLRMLRVENRASPTLLLRHRRIVNVAVAYAR